MSTPELSGFLLDGQAILEPFGEPARAMRVLDRPVEEILREQLKWVGAPCSEELLLPGSTVPGDRPALVVEDTLYLGRGLLQQFVKLAHSAGQPRAALAVAEGPFTRALGPLADLAVRDSLVQLPMYLLQPGDRVPTSPLQLPPLTVPLQESVLKVQVPEHYFGTPELVIPVTGRPFVRLLHWSQVLHANRVALTEPGARLGKLGNVLRILWAALRSGWPSVPRVARRLSTIHPTAWVHPTAVVEASVIGPGAKVGPNALVRLSHLGRDSWVMPGAQVTFSVIGAQALVTSNSVLNFCTLYPQATAANPLMQLCLLGNRCITTGGGYCIDLRFGTENIQVKHQGRLVDSGTRFLGSCFGHDVIFGTGVWLAHGRAVPNGYQIVRAPEEILSRIPEGLPIHHPLAVRRSTLEPL